MEININLEEGVRAQRKLMVTVAEWTPKGKTEPLREMLGSYTEDSSIETNANVETITDVLGITHTTVTKTEPQQGFDPVYIQKDSALGVYLTIATLTNDIDAYNGVFTIYTIMLFLGEEGAYFATKQKGCTIQVNSIGGSSYVSIPIDISYSNDIEVGTVDKFAKNFVFTPANGQTEVSTFNLPKQSAASTLETSSSSKKSTL